jgi:hypothetical protein
MKAIKGTMELQPLSLNLSEQDPRCSFHEKTIKNALERILEERILDSFEHSKGSGLSSLFHSLPLLLELKAASSTSASFCAILKARKDVVKYFLEMISSGLVPAVRARPIFVFAADFSLAERAGEAYTLLEVVVDTDTPEALQLLRSGFAAARAEICLALESHDYARRSLAAKGLFLDEKSSILRTLISRLANRRSGIFNQDLLAEMQLLLAICPENFLSARESRHLARVICLHHFFRVLLSHEMQKAPQKRHLALKIFRARIQPAEGLKSVLALSVGINFLMDKEIFDNTHLIKAIRNYIPAAVAVESSYFVNRRGSEKIVILYLEIEKPADAPFTASEISILRRALSSDLKDRIEHSMHPVFMPRNEEEIIRNILSLSNQIKYVRDIPQVFISFDEQTALHLYFIVILLRVIKTDSLPIQEMFNRADTILEYIHDRTQNAGNLRRKYRKEATVFRVKLPKDQYLRADHSIDLNRARQVVSSELSQIIGEVRDYNGGIISKQNELFSEFKNLLKGSVKYNELLLENFFFSLTPVIMRSVLEPEALRALFLMLIESVEEGLAPGKDYAVRFSMEKPFVFVMIKTEDRMIKERVQTAVSQLQLHASKLAFSSVSVYELIYLGYIYRCNEPEEQEFFCDLIRQVLI